MAPPKPVRLDPFRRIVKVQWGLPTLTVEGYCVPPNNFIQVGGILSASLPDSELIFNETTFAPGGTLFLDRLNFLQQYRLTRRPTTSDPIIVGSATLAPNPNSTAFNLGVALSGLGPIYELQDVVTTGGVDFGVPLVVTFKIVKTS